MNNIRVNIDDVLGTVNERAIEAMATEVRNSVNTLLEGNGAGNDFLGWVRLPQEISDALVDDIKATADRLRKECEVVVVVGIGGSYLGAKAVIEALTNPFDVYSRDVKTQVVFAGHNISEDYLSQLLAYLDGKQFGVIVISKSGTTTEPAIAFRLLKSRLEEVAGKEAAARRIVAITDAKRGALRTLADNEGYTTYVIPDNVGGRFSVLTPVGLLPIAVAGHDIKALVDGARERATAMLNGSDKSAEVYATTRNALYRAGKKIEILVNFNPRLHYLAEWWKQLYGESEGKEHKGLFPASVAFSTALHSMGQWIQEGERSIFETVISVANVDHELRIPTDAENLDGLNYLAGKRVDEVNKMAELGTRLAHVDGGVPNILITIDRIDAATLGSLIYFFEAACGISGYILGVNPFNQPGVEAYKRNMFALLAKPGYESETAAIRERLS
ncbi:MAG: glucose-6-phosphate isomerase [Muribaculaceae bacterium]|nr:glucose-6-phosphate isomerase [Muribaculaceae bacterium]